MTTSTTNTDATPTDDTPFDAESTDTDLAASVPGAFNLRELGGYRVERGVIRPGVLYRSDLLHRLDVDRAHRWLDDRGVRVLVDLRTEGERSGDGFIETTDSLEARHRSLLDEVWSWRDEKDSGSEWFLRDRTVDMYVNHGDRIAVVLEDLVTSNGAALFHCTAGKDRTGVVSSALLGVLGASRELIVADYARSTEAMVGIVGWYRDLAMKQAAASGEELPEFSEEAQREIVARAAAPETMHGVLDALIERFGSFDAWAADAGIDGSLVAALRAKFVDEAN